MSAFINNPTALVLALFGLTIIICALWIFSLEKRLARMFRGKTASDLEEVLVDIGRNLDQVNSQQKELETFALELQKKLRQAIQHVHTVRYNPYRDQGGNHSFATCLMDERGNGVVISGIYSRDKVNVYAKPLVTGKSDYELTEEETAAISRAKEA